MIPMTMIAPSVIVALSIGFVALVAQYRAYRRSQSRRTPELFALFTAMWIKVLLSYWATRLEFLGMGGSRLVAIVGDLAPILVLYGLAAYMVATMVRGSQEREKGSPGEVSIRGFTLIASIGATVAAIRDIAMGFAAPSALALGILCALYAAASLSVCIVISAKAVASRRSGLEPPTALTEPPSEPRTQVESKTAVSRAGESLSVRELEVARLLSGGMSYRDIGERLYIAPSTVKTHVLRVYEKLGVGNKMQLAAILFEREPRSGDPADEIHHSVDTP